MDTYEAKDLKEAEEQKIDRIVISALPHGEMETFMNFEQVMVSKHIVDSRLDRKQVEKALRRLVKGKDERIVFYQDGRAACYPDDFGSYNYKRSRI